MATAAFAVPASVNSFSAFDEYVNVETSHGKIRGIRSEGFNLFKGIPYGGRTSGDRRFRRPAQLQSWTGVRDALQLGAPTIQQDGQTRGLNEPRPSEDCLFFKCLDAG